jgi:hypothetical protein
MFAFRYKRKWEIVATYTLTYCKGLKEHGPEYVGVLQAVTRLADYRLHGNK